MFVVLKITLNAAFSYKYMYKTEADDLFDKLLRSDKVITFYDTEYSSDEILNGMELITNPEKVNAFVLLHGSELHSDIDLIQLLINETKVMLDDENDLQIVFRYDDHFKLIIYNFVENNIDGIEVNSSLKNDTESGIYVAKDDINNRLIITPMTMKEYEMITSYDTELFLTWKELWDKYYEHGLDKTIYE